ncbi:MAG: ribonuclease activity regulator RraA [Chloroflexi bacterium]|nr:ribonuclease activity regulator RraA [Chloroflexota bacterium]
MTDFADFNRIEGATLNKLREIGAATIAGALSKQAGIRNPHLVGLTPFNPGATACGQAVTLQFMPKREDLHWGDEYAAAPERELHRRAIMACQPGDIIVVDARGSMSSGVFGEMMLTSFQAQGGEGVVIDGCIRDFPEVQQLDLGLWLRGVTPNFHTQTDIFPHAVNVPIACANCFVAPGDIIVADDDGAVVLPLALAEEMAEAASAKAEWEVFSRMKLEEGGRLDKYYPLNDEAQKEYEAWLRQGAPPQSDTY